MFPLQLDVDFSDGLAVIYQEHIRMLSLCDEITVLARQVERDEKTPDFSVQANRVYRYLSVATDRHHQDEEQALFPIIMPKATIMVQGMVDCLKEDHRELEQVWEYLAPLLESTEKITDNTLFVKASKRFVQLLRWHIDREEANFLPEMETLLSMQQREEIGAMMLQLHKVAT